MIKGPKFSATIPPPRMASATTCDCVRAGARQALSRALTANQATGTDISPDATGKKGLLTWSMLMSKI